MGLQPGRHLQSGHIGEGRASHLSAGAVVLLARVGELPPQCPGVVVELLLVETLPLDRLVPQRGAFSEGLHVRSLELLIGRLHVSTCT